MTGSQPRMYSIFDTSALIGISESELYELFRHESLGGVLGLGSVWPCLETLSHCGSDDERKRSRAMATLRKIRIHTGYDTPSGPRFRVQEAGEHLLAKGLFGLTLDEPLLEIGALADLMKEAAVCEPAVFCLTQRGALRSIADRVSSEESKFAANIRMRASFDSGDKIGNASWERRDTVYLFAAGLLDTLAKQYGIDLEKVDVNQSVHKLVHNFPVALYFMRDFARDALECDVIPGGTNTVWDQKLAFHASRGASVEGVPAIVVSNDRRLLRAARAAGQGRRVIRPADYCKLLGDAQSVADYADHILHDE